MLVENIHAITMRPISRGNAATALLRSRLGNARQPAQIARADQASLEFVAARTGPMGLQADPSAVAVAPQRGNLPRPLDAALPQWPPRGLAVFHPAVLGVDVRDPGRRQAAIPFRKRNLTGHQGVGGVPDGLQV